MKKKEARSLEAGNGTDGVNYIESPSNANPAQIWPILGVRVGVELTLNSGSLVELGGGHFPTLTGAGIKDVLNLGEDGL